nr:MAG TPA: hypothetical protein [Caudoviricetes sp.]
MKEYVPEGMAEDVRSIKHSVKEIHEEKENNMNDIAGLLALMQGNKGMDLPGLLALCKDKGYDRNWGGEGMFMFVFLLLFLFSRGGWGGLNGSEQAAFNNCAGNSCQSIIGLHDRIADARSVSQLGFQSLQTWLCESIANVTNSIRNQGDRAVDATRNVGDTVRDCCCKMEAALATLNCKVDGVNRDIRESSGLISAKIELEALKAENARAAMECRIIQNQKDCCGEMNQRFDRLENTINTNRLADENARLARENSELKSQQLATTTANAAVQALQNFQLNHYTPTKTSTSGTGA